MDKAQVNTIIEGIIGLAVVLGVLFIVYTRVTDQTVLVGILSGALTSVVTFYFLRQQTASVQNGTVSAITDIVGQVTAAQDRAATILSGKESGKQDGTQRG